MESFLSLISSEPCGYTELLITETIFACLDDRIEEGPFLCVTGMVISLAGTKSRGQDTVDYMLPKNVWRKLLVCGSPETSNERLLLARWQLVEAAEQPKRIFYTGNAERRIHVAFQAK